MKLKIGIITYSRSINYGAILQCYALQEILCKMGYDVNVINYKQAGEQTYGAVLDRSYFKRNFKHPGNIVRYMLSFFRRLKIYIEFSKFKSDYIAYTHLCTEKTIPQNFNIYLLGSDQLWTLEYSGGIDNVFWGNFAHPKESVICSYAISSNKESIENTETSLLKQMFSNFKKISLRESSIKLLIERKCEGLQTQIDIDPTLLADDTIWSDIIDKQWSNGNYVVTYQVARSQDQTLYQKALELANQIGCEVINLSTYSYSPQQFVSAIKYAKCVLTTSFHGVAFGLIFHRPLWVCVLNDGHDSRYVDLLTEIGASSFLHNLNEQPKIIDADYSKIEEALKKKRISSLSYLQSLKSLIQA